jgi:ABC-2 type transport system permease protein
MIPDPLDTMFRTIFAHEIRLILRDRSAAIVGAVLLLSVVCALMTGRAEVDRRQTMVDRALAEEEQTFSDLRARARPTDDLDVGSSGFDASTNAASLSLFYPRPAALPPAPLAILSVGQADVYPSIYGVTGERKDSFLDAVELANPLHSLTGAFDISFVVVFLLPLLLLVLGHDMLSREREGGTLDQLLAHPVSLRTFVGAKLLARGTVVLAAIAATGLGLLVLGELPDREAWFRFGLWSLIVAAYGGFWLGVSALVDAWGRQPARNAVLVCGVWLLLALVGPALLHLASSRLQPVPPRSDLLLATRDVETDSRRPVEYLTAYYAEHPDHYPSHPEFNIEVYDFPLYWAAIQREVDRQLEPNVRRFDEALDAQEGLAGRLRLLAPVALAAEALNDVSGSGLRRYRSFTRQVLAFHDDHRAFFEPFVFSKTPLTPGEYDRMPRFVFAEENGETVARQALGSALALFVTAAVTIVAAAVGYGLAGRRRIV